MFGSYKFLLLFSIIAIFILWHLLLPGYVLTLDMIFVPDPQLSFASSGYLNSLPLSYFLKFLGNIIPAWVVQKGILFFLFFSLGYISFRFLPLGQDVRARMFGAIFYTVNPFVYTRFLAGHWTLLLAYATLPIFLHFLLQYFQLRTVKNILGVSGTLFLISIFSLHLFVMCWLLLFGTWLYYFLRSLQKKDTKNIKTFIWHSFFGGAVFTLLAGYWLVPFFLHGNSFEQRFDKSHWQTFAATSHGEVNTSVNILALFGFWGENQPWAEQFVWPQEYLFFWAAMGCIWLLVLLGIVTGWKDSRKRPLVLFFSCLATVSFVFSTGVGESPFESFHLWIYDHIGFWRGFRDSQKWSAFLAVSYTVLASFGVEAIFIFLEKRKKQLLPLIRIVILSIPILVGFFVWGGFRGQLRSVMYPEAWDRVKLVIDADSSEKKVLFLPWHGYLSFKFNHNILLANPARAFFGPKSIVSKSIELLSIYDQETNLDYYFLDRRVREIDQQSPDETIHFLLENNIKYIVFFQDLQGVDPLSYTFLSSSKIHEIFRDSDLVMYEILED